jgi:hypothetical protein
MNGIKTNRRSLLLAYSRAADISLEKIVDDELTL